MNRASNLVPVFELISSAHTIKLSLICILQTTDAPTPLPHCPPLPTPHSFSFYYIRRILANKTAHPGIFRPRTR